MGEVSGGLIGVLLAGGLSRRMGGGDKSLLTLRGKTILQRTIDRITPQVSDLVLNANGSPSRFKKFGLPVVADLIHGNLGPLVGILSGMEWCKRHLPESKWLVTLPTDAPFLPVNMVSDMFEQLRVDGSDIACAASNSRTHPPFAIWRNSLSVDLRRAITEEGIRKIDSWTERYVVSHVDFTAKGFDPFFNINHPKDLKEARNILDRFPELENEE